MRMRFTVIVGLILLVIFVSPVIAATVWTPGSMADVGYEDRNINTFHWVWGLNYNQKPSQTNDVNVPFQLNASARVRSVTVRYFTSGPTAKITHLRVDSGAVTKYNADIIPALTGGVNYKTIDFGSLIKMPQGMTASFWTTTDASGPGNFQFTGFAISGNNLT